MDIRILKLLSKNCRMSYEQIARYEKVTSTTIKQRIRSLQKEGKLSGFVICLNNSLTGGEDIFHIVSTDGEKSTENITNSLRESNYIRSIGKLANGKYLIKSHSKGNNDLIITNRHLSAISCVVSIESFPLWNSPHKKPPTLLQLKILDVMKKNPRMKSNDIAKIIGHSSKGIRLAIERIQANNIASFSIISSFFMFFVIAECENNLSNPSLLTSHLENQFPCLWEIQFSKIDSKIFLFFATESTREVDHIQREIKKIKFLDQVDSSIFRLLQYYS